MNELINAQARQHEETVQGWDYQETSKTLYHFFDLLNERFFSNKLPTPVLSFQRTRALGHYVVGRNEIGVHENINISARHLADARAQVIQTLAHEMVHAYEKNCGKLSKGNYHDVECQQKMKEIGIPCDRWGRSLGMKNPFVAFLTEHDIKASVQTEASVQTAAPEPCVTRTSKSRLKNWRCNCTSIWSTANVQAVCTVCGKTFVRC